MLFKLNFKKTAAIVSAAIIAATSLTGCVGNEVADGKVKIRISHWPSETNVNYEVREQERLKFMEENPDIIVEPDTWSYEPQSFIMMATSGQLPNLVLMPFTEAKRTVTDGYAANIADALSKHGFLDSLNPSLLEILSDDNGRVFGIPEFAYAQGLYINKALFIEAGLVNEDGSVKIPSTYEEVAECAKIVREKTGKAGFLFPSTGNGGGWNLLNIAWSYGTEFLKQDENGKYIADFNSPEFKAALKYLYDLKWTYNAIQDNAVLSIDEQRKLFGTGQGAMTIYSPPGDEMSIKYGMDRKLMVAGRVPEGPAGRYSQMGGNYWMMGANSTPEQIEATMKWIMYRGVTPEVTEESKAAWGKLAKQTFDNGGVVLDRSAFSLWVNEERLKAEQEANAPYVNVDPHDYDDYFSFADVIIRPEPEICAQELYSVLDKTVQEIFTNKDVDFDVVTETAVKDFQMNHLDKID